MAVATPERTTELTEDELHNARISENYRRLMDPEYKLNDLLGDRYGAGSQPAQPVRNASYVQPQSVQNVNNIQSQPVRNTVNYVQPPVQNAVNTPVMLVQGARSDADIFRADNPINRAYFQANGSSLTVNVQPVQSYSVEEEDNEDLRPTSTTIQYQTVGADGVRLDDNVINAYREGETDRPEEAHSSRSGISFSKRDKIIMGVILGLIFAVFVLIIVNSAIISNLNSEISDLDVQLAAVQEEVTDGTYAQEYAQLEAELKEITSEENVYERAVEQGIINN